MNNYITPPPTPDGVPLNLEVVVGESEKCVYLKISGFEDLESTTDYAEHLAEILPLVLFDSDVKH